jgi:hypothetical protein
MTDACIVLRSGARLFAHAGTTVCLEGVYWPVDVRRHRPLPEVYAGHAMLVLADGTHVLLGAVWDPPSRRSVEEHARLDGRRAVALGVLRPFGIESPEGGAVPVLPCLHPLEAVIATGES